MERNFKLIFEGIFSILIFINIVVLLIMVIDYALNLNPSYLNIVRFDLLVSFLIIVDTILRLKNEKNKIQYLSRNWIDILAIIPLAYIAILIIPNAHIIIIILFLIRIYALLNYMLKLKGIRKLARKTKLDYATIILIVTLIFGSIFFYLVESPVNPTASTLDSSIFFLIVSMTTVGYGNTVPVTHIGQLIAVTAIIVGLGYTGWVTATMASSLVQEFRKESDKRVETQNKSKELILKKLEKLDKIEKELEELKRK